MAESTAASGCGRRRVAVYGTLDRAESERGERGTAVTGSSVAFLLDVDNTLLDNDRFVADLTAQLDRWFGRAERDRFWSIYDRLRAQEGYADYLGTVQQFRIDLEDDPALLLISAFLLEYPFAERLFPKVVEVIAHLRTQGATVVLSDGDAIFQPRKIERSGLWEALHGAVLIYRHKERMLASVQRRYPADHYVMVDDKPGLLAEMKRALGNKLTTVFVAQGHYAAAGTAGIDPKPDLTIVAIGELLGFDR